MKKKLVSLMLACTMLFSLSACGSEEAAPAQPETSTAQETETVTEVAEPEEEAAAEEIAEGKDAHRGRGRRIWRHVRHRDDGGHTGGAGRRDLG